MNALTFTASEVITDNGEDREDRSKAQEFMTELHTEIKATNDDDFYLFTIRAFSDMIISDSFKCVPFICDSPFSPHFCALNRVNAKTTEK